MSMPYQDLEKRLLEVLTEASGLLPGESFEEARGYIEHNEFELALDTIAATLANAGVRVDHDLYAKFVSLGNEMKLNESTWTDIRPM